jgi:hypothetical protein
MKTPHPKSRIALALALAGMLSIAPAIAEKPSWAGGGKSDRGERANKGGGEQAERRDYFESRQRVAVHDYYDGQYRSGRCPPGLAKKHNGCMPPGQAKKWQIGQPLPHGVVYYTVPQSLVTQIGRPPAGHRYVRVSSDILLMTLGSRMVVDAIRDLGRS